MAFRRILWLAVLVLVAVSVAERRAGFVSGSVEGQSPRAAWAQTATIATTDFLSILPEIPLPAGFVEYTEEAIVFDKPAGRIAEAAAFGATDAEVVRQFYADTLPSLGWQESGELVWLRDSEELRLEILAEEAATQVRFFLRPH